MTRRRSPRLVIDAFPQAKKGVHLTFRSKTLTGKVGRGIATFVRKAVRRGQTPDGEALVRGADGKRAWRDTGELIRLIKFQKGLVSGWGQHSSGMNAAGLMGVLIFGRRSWRRHGGRTVSPFDAESPAVTRQGADLATKELERQLAKGQARITFGRGRSTATGGKAKFTRRSKR